MLSAPLPRITAEQCDLPGMGPGPLAVQPGRQVTSVEPVERVWNPDQLCLMVVQQVLCPGRRPVRQLALLDDPPVWEVDPKPKPRPRRRRRTPKPLLSPGQMPLF